MRIRRLIGGGLRLLSSRCLGQRWPLAVGLAITHRCNSQCSYCNIARLPAGKELSTHELCELLADLARLGCVRVGITGGEPLLRSDLGQILEQARSCGISTSVTSNGLLVPRQLAALKKTERLILSVDGLSEVQDAQRGADSFASVERAVRLARAHGIPVSYAATLTRHSAPRLDGLLALARAQRVPLMIQFASHIALTRNALNGQALNHDERQAVVARLLSADSPAPFLLNSPSGLRALARERVLPCASGRIFFRITAQGRLYSCWRQRNDQSVDLRRTPLEQALRDVPAPTCDQCDVADGVELSLVHALHGQAILHTLRRQL